jgi:peptidoglycan/LPS O-acetylase OafA/YrhL
VERAGKSAGERISERDLGLDHLRAWLVVLVVVFHATLGYADFGVRVPMALVPIVDAVQWRGFSSVTRGLDVFFMALMFLISGLFVSPGLARDGAAGFLRRRALRLGLPFVLGVTFMMPAAYYPAALALGAQVDFFTYWDTLIGHGIWYSGPLWFVFLLLAFDLITALGSVAIPKAGHVLDPLVAKADARPLRMLLIVIVCGCVAYLPLLFVFGPYRWIGLGPFGFQASRLLHYALYFFVGVAVGAHGLDRGLLARAGALARQWPWWLLSAGLVQAVWLAQPQTWFATSVGVWLLLEGLGFVVTCAVTSFALLALSRRLTPRGSATGRSFTSSSYGIYLLHYVFVIWAQYLLLGSAVPAWVKIVAVSVAAVGSSWLCSVLFRHLGLLLRRRLRAGVGIGAPGGA